MHVKDWQRLVDEWIQEIGVRYFDIKTNTILLMEEIGEMSRIIARMHGEQSFKDPMTAQEQRDKLEEELGDVIFVLTCIANQSGINLTEILKKNLDKKSIRDVTRHRDNPKLKHP
ncbi:MAG: nucleotide pyrophosphohydrolase [Saprospiraceae bacterium]|nr:nucleotide pyrophosphohydrolase [Saprospiraceae bacterium]